LWIWHGGRYGAPVTARPSTHASRPLRVGFLPLTDAAPLVVAKSRGIFARNGIRVELSREVGWATVREKIRLGELDAAQAPAPMLWAMHLGLSCPSCPVLTAFILNLNGNALTLARALGPRAHDPAGLREIARERRATNPLTIGTVFPYSSHNLLIRDWLLRSGLIPERDVRIVIVPPAQMFRNLAAGTLDGYCAGEPWNSLAVTENVGWCPAWSAGSSLPSVEKVLMVTSKFAESRPSEHAALVASLSEAAAWCDKPENRAPLADLLAEPAYVNVATALISPPLLGHFDRGLGAVESVPDFHVFSNGKANIPEVQKAKDLQQELQTAELVPRKLDAGLPALLFREDLYSAAVGDKPLSKARA